MITKDNVHEYLKAIAKARNELINGLKTSFSIYQAKVATVDFDYSIMSEPVNYSEVDKLRRVGVCREVFDLVENYNAKHAFDDYDFCWIEIDGIRLEAIVYKGDTK